MNPWLIVGAVGVASSEKARHLVREGVVHGLATVISIGESAYGVAREAASEAEGAATGVARTASRGTGRVTGVVGDVIEEAKARAHGDEGRETVAGKKRAS
jgi:hypothetical protein